MSWCIIDFVECLYVLQISEEGAQSIGHVEFRCCTGISRPGMLAGRREAGPRLSSPKRVCPSASGF